MYIVGKVLKPHGIKGEVKVEVITSFPQHFQEIKQVFIEKDGYQPLQIERFRLSESFIFIKFKEIKSRNEADTIRNLYLYIPEEGLLTLQDDEYYYHQLIGMEVYSEENRRIGKVTGIESYPANDVLVVKEEQMESLLIPLIKDVIRNIDLKSQRVTIRLIEGLLG